MGLAGRLLESRSVEHNHGVQALFRPYNPAVKHHLEPQFLDGTQVFDSIDQTAMTVAAPDSRLGPNNAQTKVQAVNGEFLDRKQITLKNGTRALGQHRSTSAIS